MLSSLTRAILAALAAAQCAQAFYIPGVQPEEFKKGEPVHLKVNSLTSIRTQVPMDYYHLPFCQPKGGVKMASQNLGEFLTGNKIRNSPYVIKMLQKSYCSRLCQVELYKDNVKRIVKHIKQDYHHNWIIDNLPSASIMRDISGSEKKHFSGGFPIGFVDRKSKDPYIFNHVNIQLDYHQPDPTIKAYRVVGFSVEPVSVAHTFSGGYEWDGKEEGGLTKPLETCTPNAHVSPDRVQKGQIVEENQKILFTYDVVWKESPVAWASRWNVYLSEDNLVPSQVHWYSIANSISTIIIFLVIMAVIVVRNLRDDNDSQNTEAGDIDKAMDEATHESGWKVLHADVFRPPQTRPMLYCVFVGTGSQLGVTALICIVLSALGILNPSRRGSLFTAILVYFAFCGIVAGYVSSRLYQSFGGSDRQRCTVLTATVFPGTAFSIFLVFNVILFFLHSTASVPVVTIAVLALLWCGVSMPLVFLGAYFGYKKDAIEFPTVTSTVARAIPPPRPVFNPTHGIFVAGIMPFAAAYVELFFIMSSLWMDQYYYVFGFTLIVYLILILTCAVVTMLVVYSQLHAENHRWWWLAFFAPGSTALYIFLYSVFYFRSLNASGMLITYFLYFGYMFLISISMLLVLGAVGVLTSLWFMRKIYGTLKVD